MSVEALQLLAMPALVAAILIRRSERRVVRALRAAGALSEATATGLPPLHALGRWQLERLRRAGAVISQAPGRFYLAPEGYSAFRGARRRRAAIVVPAILAIALLSMLLTR